MASAESDKGLRDASFQRPNVQTLLASLVYGRSFPSLRGGMAYPESSRLHATAQNGRKATSMPFVIPPAVDPNALMANLREVVNTNGF